MENLYAPPQAEVRDIVELSTTVMAERGTRLGASILDSVIFVALVYVPFLVAGAVGAAASPSVNGGPSAGVVGLGILFGLVGFVIWCWFTIRNLMRNGQSIAKKTLGIKVVRSDGSPVSLGRLFWLRNAVVGVLGLIPLFSVVDALFIFGESRQCLHDKIADTIVILA